MKILCFTFHTKNKFLLFTEELVRRYHENRISYTSGSMAYFFTLSLFPFIMFLSSLIGILNFDSKAILQIISPFFAEQIVNIIISYNDYVANVSSPYTLIFSIVISLYSASRAIGSMIIAINSVYAIERRRFFVTEYLLSAAFTVAVGIIIFLFAFAIIIGGKLLESVYVIYGKTVPHMNVVIWITVVSALIAIFFIILFLYYFAPNRKMKIKNLIWGSVFSALGISVMGIGISIYVRLSARFSLLYGSIGAIIIIMLWFYLFGNVVLIGAQINRIYESLQYSDDD